MFKPIETIGEMTIGEVLALALAAGPTKFVGGPLPLLVEIVVSCDLIMFYSYLVLAQGQLRSLVRWSHILHSKDQQNYSIQLEGMRASMQHWLYSTFGVCVRIIRWCSSGTTTVRLRPTIALVNRWIPHATTTR